MYDSVLNVRGLADVLEAIKQVWSSTFSERVMAYRRRHGLPSREFALAVLVQQMIDARQSGVMFTCDPTTGHTDTVLIDAVIGNGAALVQGDVDATPTVSGRATCTSSVRHVRTAAIDSGAEHPVWNRMKRDRRRS